MRAYTDSCHVYNLIDILVTNDFLGFILETAASELLKGDGLSWFNFLVLEAFYQLQFFHCYFNRL